MDSWTQRRLDLVRALREVDPLCGDLYRRAVELLSATPWNMGSLIVVAHCVREVANSLPDLLGDVEVPPFQDLSRPAQDLARAWDRHLGEQVGTEVSLAVDVAGDADPTPVRTVPLDFLESVRLVVRASERGRINGRLRASALVLGRLEEHKDPSVELFRDALRFFLRYVHLNAARMHALPSVEDVIAQFTLIEATLISRVGRFFAAQEDILDIVARANQQRPEESV